MELFIYYIFLSPRHLKQDPQEGLQINMKKCQVAMKPDQSILSRLTKSKNYKSQRHKAEK